MSKENINTLRSIRDFAEQLMNGFRRIADEHPDSFVGLEPVTQTLMICAAGDMAGAEAMCRVTEAFGPSIRVPTLTKMSELER
jgi:hypothetical protein